MSSNRTLKQRFASSRLHRIYLEAAALKQRLSYASQRTQPSSANHHPKVLCIGNFKTGTVSLTALLGQKLRGAHEPHAYLYSQGWLKHCIEAPSPDAWKDFLISRNNSQHLDFEASGFLTLEAAILYELYPHTQFILSIREPISWVRSMLRHIIKNRAIIGHNYWEPAFKHYFATEAFPADERSLQEQQLFSIQSLLDYWKHSNQRAIQAIPTKQLLILDTKKLSNSIGQLETFMNWEINSLERSKTHLHPKDSSADLLADIPEAYINHLAAPYTNYFRDLAISSD
jgi:hypothetical protein